VVDIYLSNMKGSLFAAAAMVGSAMADGVHRRHDAFHQRREASSSAWPSVSPSPSAALNEEVCGCTTKVITYYGSATLIPIETSTPVPESTSTLTSTVSSTSTSTLTVTVSATPSSVPAPAPVSTSPASSSAPVVQLPTPGVSTFSTTGVYTIPATTITVTDATTVCGATSTDLPSGTHTYGGVTTIVETATTVTCPYATVKPSGTTVTSVIETTTYVCPTAGTYTVVPPTTTEVPTSTVLVYPTPHTITPGTYTQSASTLTVTRTDYTYVCPAPTGGLASTTAPAPTTVPATTTAAASSTSSTAAATSTHAPLVLGEGQYGMTYSPYTEGGDCKTKQEVSKDLKTIQAKGFNLIRVYSTDCSSLEFIGDACKELGLNMILGVFIDGSGIAGAQEQVDAISKWAEWSMVELIVVGNEAIQSGTMDAPSLASFIKSAGSTFKAAGYNGKITTTEPVNVWQSYGASSLCDAVDLVGANIHPFFNADVTAEKAGDFAKQEFEFLEKICGGKDVINLETGWPNAGESNGAAIPGKTQQMTAVRAIAKAVGSKSIFFSYSDDLWKNPGDFNVEQHWGCSDVFN
jgi:exo-beta-1,3-glucanase (GH17 family)